MKSQINTLNIEVCVIQFFIYFRVLKFQSGEFVVPEPGLYLFLVTCCTYDMKKCLLSIRKNGKDVANIHDQDGDTNKVVQDCYFSMIIIWVLCHHYDVDDHDEMI